MLTSFKLFVRLELLCTRQELQQQASSKILGLRTNQFIAAHCYEFQHLPSREKLWHNQKFRPYNEVRVF